MLLALRRTAPRAPIVFVGWSRRGKLSISEQIVSAAHQHAVEVIDLAALVQRLDEARVLAIGGPPSGMATRGGSEARRTVQTLYAQGGRDFVHPSPLGHAVIAAATARHIAMRLRAGLCASAASRTEPRNVGARRGVDAAARPSVAGIGGGRAIDGASAQDDVEGFDESVGSWEQCWTALVLGRFPVAGASGVRGGAAPFPVAGASGVRGGAAPVSTWSRVDDGASKGVPKMGLASWRVGETLTLGPLPGPPGVGAAPLVAELGYFISPRAGQGAFRIDCYGCNCTAVRTIAPPLPLPHLPTPRVNSALLAIACAGCSSLALPLCIVSHARQMGAPAGSASLVPFPVVETDATVAQDRAYARMNASVTATTEFLVLWMRRVPCSIVITHMPSATKGRRHAPGVGMQPEQKRIRLDSLFLRPLNLAGYAYHLKKVPAYTWRMQLANLASEEDFVFGSHALQKLEAKKSS